jgi:hypothetical protein
MKVKLRLREPGDEVLGCARHNFLVSVDLALAILLDKSSPPADRP